MLGSFMEDMSITADKFQHALKLSASRDIKKQFQTTAFEQVWAADDYPVFKRMMVQRNIELQLQALELLQHKYVMKSKNFFLLSPKDGFIFKVWNLA